MDPFLPFPPPKIAWCFGPWLKPGITEDGGKGRWDEGLIGNKAGAPSAPKPSIPM